MQRDPKDAGEAQEKFPFLVPSVMSRRIFKKQELTSLQAAWIRKLVPRWTTHVKQICVLGDTQPPVQLTIRGLVQTPAGDGTMIPEAWCFFICFPFCAHASLPMPHAPSVL